jgi:hypothetical protein
MDRAQIAMLLPAAEFVVDAGVHHLDESVADAKLIAGGQTAD